jgi:hypothetical protein
MRRYTFPAFKTAPTLRYVVLWDLHWQLLEVQRLDPAADLGGAMAAAIARLKGDGWQAEAMPEYGFVLPTPSATDVRCRLSHWPEMPTPIKTTIKPLKTHRGHARE